MREIFACTKSKFFGNVTRCWSALCVCKRIEFRSHAISNLTFSIILINRLYLSCCFKHDDLLAINFGCIDAVSIIYFKFCLLTDATYLSFCLSSIILSCIAFKFRHSIAIGNLAIIRVQHLLSRRSAMYDNSRILSIKIRIKF